MTLEQLMIVMSYFLFLIIFTSLARTAAITGISACVIDCTSVCLLMISMFSFLQPERNSGHTDLRTHAMNSFTSHLNLTPSNFRVRLTDGVAACVFYLNVSAVPAVLL